MTRKNFNELRRKLRERAPNSDAAVARYREAMKHDLSLADVRRAREFTQQQIAGALDTNQSGVSRIEHQTDLYLSTLRSFIEAMGGVLEIKAVFPDGEVTINTVETAGDHTEKSRRLQSASRIRVGGRGGAR
jgi:transcriptional regulator